MVLPVRFTSLKVLNLWLYVQNNHYFSAKYLTNKMIDGAFLGLCTAQPLNIQSSLMQLQPLGLICLQKVIACSLFITDIHFCWRGNLLSCHHSQWITMKNIKLQQTTRTLPGFTRRCPESRNLMNSTDDLFPWKHKSLSLFWYVFPYANVRMFCGACKVFTSLTFLLITEEFYFGQRKKNASQIDYICMF